MTASPGVRAATAVASEAGAMGGKRPVFGGRGVGIGFAGTYDGEGAECEATALAGKRSIRFRAVLRKLVAA